VQAMTPEQMEQFKKDVLAKAQELVAEKEQAEMKKGPPREMRLFTIDDHTESGRTISVGDKIGKKEILSIRLEADPIFQVTFCCYLKGQGNPIEAFPAATVRAFRTVEIEESRIKLAGPSGIVGANGEEMNNG